MPARPAQVANGGVQARLAPPPVPAARLAAAARAIQPKVGFEFELGSIKTQKRTRRHPPTWVAHARGEMIKRKTGYDVTADSGPGGVSQIEFIIKEVDENDRAECARAVTAANEIVADIRDLAQVPNVGNWVAGSRTRIRTSPGHQFNAEHGFDRILGQLQATAGLSISRLPEVVSGRAADLAGRRPPSGWSSGRGPVRTVVARPFLGTYSSFNGQPIWRAARTETRRFTALDDHQQEVLASVITMIAQAPLSFRNEDPGTQGMFTAKTDFSKILAEAITYIGRPIDYATFEAVVLNTINEIIRQGNNPANVLQPTDGVFPAGYRANGVALGGLSIRQWLRAMLPNRGGQGTDLMTPQSFPGTRRQREEMRAFGRMGNQVDPGNRPIVEFRNLTSVAPDRLPDAVSGILEYVRSANAPPTRPTPPAPPTSWGTYLAYGAAATATVATIYFRNEIGNWLSGGGAGSAGIPAGPLNSTFSNSTFPYCPI
jgi:hypothetical protein